MEIFDAYLEDLAKQEKAKEKKPTKGAGGRDELTQKKSTGLEVQVTLVVGGACILIGIYP